MKLNEQIFEEIKKEIVKNESLSFNFTSEGRLSHFISAEGESRGLYVARIIHNGKEYKIYMI